MTLKAASRRLGLKIIVVQSVGGSWGSPCAFGSSAGGASPLVLGLSCVPGAEHYILLRPKTDGSIPSAWLNALQAEEQLLASQSDLRGAGISDGSGWLPPRTPSQSKVGKWLPSILFGLRTCVPRLLRLLLVRTLLGLIVRFGLALGVPLRFVLVRVLCCALGVAIIWKGIIKSGSLGGWAASVRCC